MDERWRSVRLGLLVALIGLVGCGSMNDDGEPPPDAFKVLFIGNSLTYTYDVPKTVAAIAETEGARPLYYKTVAEPNYALEDHWLIGGIQSRIANGDWDAIVFQQGPSSLPANQAHLAQWSKVLADEARKAGAIPAAYMVWPANVHAFTFPGVVESYTNAAQAADALLLPAGKAWQEAWSRDPTLPLYGSDGFHQSRLGTYLAALVIYVGLYDDLPNTLPIEVRVDGKTVALGGEGRRLLRDAVQAAYAE